MFTFLERGTFSKNTKTIQTIRIKNDINKKKEKKKQKLQYLFILTKPQKTCHQFICKTIIHANTNTITLQYIHPLDVSKLTTPVGSGVGSFVGGAV